MHTYMFFCTCHLYLTLVLKDFGGSSAPASDSLRMIHACARMRGAHQRGIPSSVRLLIACSALGVGLLDSGHEIESYKKH